MGRRVPSFSGADGAGADDGVSVGPRIAMLFDAMAAMPTWSSAGFELHAVALARATSTTTEGRGGGGSCRPGPASNPATTRVVAPLRPESRAPFYIAPNIAHVVWRACHAPSRAP